MEERKPGRSNCKLKFSNVLQMNGILKYVTVICTYFRLFAVIGRYYVLLA